MIRYDKYLFSPKEWLFESIKAVMEVVFLGMLFFRSFWGCLALVPYGVWQVFKTKEDKAKGRLACLRTEFKDVILSIAFSLQAGYAMEQTIGIARKDLERMTSRKSDFMIQELIWMERGMALGQSIDQLFLDLARRSGLREIQSYAQVLSVARKQGGNLVQISKNAAEHISKSIQVEQELDQVLAGKKMEKEIMLIMPYFILIYLQLTNGSYLDPLFEGVGGRGLMSFCLIGIFIARFWAEKIIDIRWS